MSNRYEPIGMDGDEMNESVDQLRARLDAMKRLMADRRGGDSDEPWRGATSVQAMRSRSGIIDGSFLSVVFGGALVVIISVSVYAFYNLYHAILKKFPSTHTEL